MGRESLIIDIEDLGLFRVTLILVCHRANLSCLLFVALFLLITAPKIVIAMIGRILLDLPPGVE